MKRISKAEAQEQWTKWKLSQATFKLTVPGSGDFAYPVPERDEVRGVDYVFIKTVDTEDVRVPTVCICACAL